MTEQIHIFVLLLGVAQWALLILFLFRKRRGLSDVYFMLMLFVIGLQMVFKVASKIWLMENVRLAYVLSYELPYLIGPLLFLMVKARMSVNFNKKDIVHGLPFLLSCLMAVSYKIRFIPFLGLSPYGHAFLQLSSLGIYTALAWRLTQNDSRAKNIGPFIMRLATAESLIILALAIMYVYYRRFPDVRLLFAALTFLIYWISYKQMTKPIFFIMSDPVMTTMPQVNRGKYTHSSLKAEESDRIFLFIQRAMTEQKLYLDPDLTIDTLADRVNVSRHHLSQVINARFQKSYFDLINDHRLSEVKTRLLDSKYGHFTIAAVALDSGFNSVSSFNDLFKKRFGMPPSRFRELNLRKMTA